LHPICLAKKPEALLEKAVNVSDHAMDLALRHKMNYENALNLQKQLLEALGESNLEEKALHERKLSRPLESLRFFTGDNYFALDNYLSFLHRWWYVCIQGCQPKRVKSMSKRKRRLRSSAMKLRNGSVVGSSKCKKICLCPNLCACGK
jgi:hypothetical protein